jgi:hypothetical protein
MERVVGLTDRMKSGVIGGPPPELPPPQAAKLVTIARISGHHSRLEPRKV